MKKLLAFVLAAVMVLSLAACGSSESGSSAAPDTKAAENDTTPAAEQPSESEAAGLPADGPTFNIQLAHCDTESSPMQTTALKFKELTEAKSGGKITVTIYPNSQMGSDGDNLTNVKIGDLQAAFLATSLTASENNAAYSCSIPFNFAGWATEDLQKLASDSEWREAMNKAANDSGFVLGTIVVGQPMYFNTKEPVEKFEDFAGKKIRVAQSAANIAMINALGAAATPLAYSELYMSLQQGLVDGWYNQPATMLACKSYEQATYVTKLAPSVSFVSIILNKAFVDGMPEAYQAVLSEALAETEQFGDQTYADLLNSNLDELGKYVTYIEVTDEFVQQCIEAEKDAVAEQKARVEDQSIITALENSMKKIKGN
ncbi:MAG: TRAP transporter substrate-binding protein [Lachnospiraceae bacterium]|nr:TRAP transporter substrate-binding protein [Lachnospiraceae bacterium]